MSSRSNRLPGGLIVWAAAGLLVSLVLILACAGVFLLRWGRGELEATEVVRVTPSPAQTATRAVTPPPSKTPTREKTPTAARGTPTRTSTARPTRPTGTPTAAPGTPTRTTTATPRATAQPSRTPTRAAAPTPVVCDDLQSLANQTLAPGQQFTCTFSEDELNDQLSRQPNVPCSRTDVDLTGGQIHLACVLGFRLTAVSEVEAVDCRIAVTVVGGTFGFTDVVKQLLEENEALVPYDRICVEKVTVGEGEMVISGYGR